jgi:hypothetical protein
MIWSPLKFGKFAGKSLPQIVFTDPDWFFWAWGNDVFDKHGPKVEATKVNERARSIRIPSEDGVERDAVYVLHPVNGKVVGVECLPKGQPYRGGGVGTIRNDVIDLSVPRRLSHYDKTGGKFVACVAKSVLFPGVGRVTQQRLEAFFDDDSNFAI